MVYLVVQVLYEGQLEYLIFHKWKDKVQIQDLLVFFLHPEEQARQKVSGFFPGCTGPK